MATSLVDTEYSDILPALRPPTPSILEHRSPLFLQAFKQLGPDTHLEHSSRDYIDPSSNALGPATTLHSGQELLLMSSQLSQSQSELQPEAVRGLLALPGSGYDFSSCDEDADGEPDDSFRTDHSFWMSHPGDTSVSTVATFDADDPPVPLLGRDGKWQGAEPPRIVIDDREHRRRAVREDASPEMFPTAELAPIPDVAPFTDAPARRTQQKRATLTHDTSSDEAGPSLTKRPRTVAATPSSKPSKSPKRAVKKPTKKRASPKKKTPTRKKQAAPGQTTPVRASGSRLTRQQALSSDSGDRPATSGLFSSPTSGRYKLRSKDNVSKLSLAAILTPPRQPGSRSYGEAEDASAEWLEQGDRMYAEALASNIEQAQDNDYLSSDEVPLAGPSVRKRGEEAPQQQQAQDNDEQDDSEYSRLEIDTALYLEKGQRVFPPDWEINPEFPLLYQRYYVSSSVSPEVLEMLLRGINYANVDDKFHAFVDRAQAVHGAFNKPRSILDLYTPRFVKGVSAQKVGMCPVCYEEGRVKFLKTKFSAYNYHMQNFHGISALTGLPFTPPMHFRAKSRPNAKPKERKQLVQGHCHSCKKWIDMQGPKDTDVKVAEIYWWKHAQACHRKSRLPDGIAGWFVENKAFERVCAVLELIDGFEGEVRKLLAGK